MPQSIGVEAESWTECELNWAGPKSSGYFCICRTVSLFCTRRSHFIDTDTANSGPPKTEKKKNNTKVWPGFFWQPAAWHHFELLRIGVRTALSAAAALQPQKNTKTGRCFTFALFLEVFLISFRPVFSVFFFLGKDASLFFGSSWRSTFVYGNENETEFWWKWAAHQRMEIENA